jgi:hypothetical protein
LKDILASHALALVLALAFNVACRGQSPDAVRNDGKSIVGQSQDSATILLRLRVEDRSGKPLPKAKGVLFRMMPPRTQVGRQDSKSTITKAGGTALSGNDGYVETSRMPVMSAYGLEIQADGFALEVTRWTHPTQSGAIELPPVQLRQLGIIAGTVVDRQGIQFQASRSFSPGTQRSGSKRSLAGMVISVSTKCPKGGGARERDPAAARHALSQSIEFVKPLRAGFVYPMSEFYHSPAVLMALLVPTAERIDPALAPRGLLASPVVTDCDVGRKPRTRHARYRHLPARQPRPVL